jgi:hypothetical protein
MYFHNAMKSVSIVAAEKGPSLVGTQAIGEYPGVLF